VVAGDEDERATLMLVAEAGSAVVDSRSETAEISTAGAAGGNGSGRAAVDTPAHALTGWFVPDARCDDGPSSTVGARVDCTGPHGCDSPTAGGRRAPADGRRRLRT